MGQGLRLYIMGEEVDLSSAPGIVYNYVADEIMNPSVVRNSYSKTITIPGTDRNNKIFNQYWDLERVNFEDGFRANRKNQFSIYFNSTLYETGYCRLDKITKKLGTITYTLSLFGGLGDFLYSLDYSEDDMTGEGRQKRLSDLVFRYDGEGSEEINIDFAINIDTIEEAWDNINGYSSPWRLINFAPAYNGLPSDFDADKVLINVNGVGSTRPNTRPSGNRNQMQITTAVTDGSSSFTVYNGYVLAEMNDPKVESEMREFRSYLQRPVVRCKEIVNACCLPENNGGYTVNLDQDFFNYDNPYWEDAWLTLPMLTSFDYIGSAESSAATATLGAAEISTSTGTTNYYNEERTFTISEHESTKPMTISVDLDIQALVDSNPGYPLYPSCRQWSNGEKHYMSSIMVQLVAYDGFGKVVAGSDLYNLTSLFGTRRGGSDGRETINIIPTPQDFGYYPPYGNTYVTQTYGFVDDGNGHYYWGGPLKMTIKNVPSISTVKLLIKKAWKSTNYHSWNYLFASLRDPYGAVMYQPYTFSGFDIKVNSINVSFTTDTAIRTGSRFSKDTLLNTEFSPSDFLLSYCKMFGMYFTKDVDTKTVNILTRRNFFKRNEIVDIHEDIDRAEDITITPIPFDKKWYEWTVPYDDSEYGDAYKKLYGEVFGSQRINTSYNFNNSTESVLKDTMMKGAVQATERSGYYCFNPAAPSVGSWYYDGFKYLLFDQNDNTNTYDIELAAVGTIDLYSGMTEYKYYDLFDKVQLHKEDNSTAEGKNVLLFFNGFQDLTVNGANLGYIISDDNSTMSILNDSKACWLWSATDTDINGERICAHITEAPKFSRYIMYPSSGYITKSWDFGRPQEVFIPNAVNLEDGTIYNQVWKNYISDLYDENTRIVECKMRLKGKPSIDWLRRFYWFNNGIYRMISISDWDMSGNGTTKVKFVKVQDVNNYDMTPITNTPTVSIALSSTNISPNGETVNWYVSVSDGGSWYLEYSEDLVFTGLDQYGGGHGDSTGTVTFPENTLGTPKTYYIYVFADPASDSITIEQGYSQFSINRTDPSAIIPASGGSTQFLVVSDLPWSAYTQNSGFATVAPTAGTATEGTLITMTLDENDYFSSRTANLIGTNGFTQLNMKYAVMQAAKEGESAVLQPPYDYYFGPSATAMTVNVNCTDDWVWSSYGIATTDLPDPSRCSSAITSFTYSLPANTGGTKYDMPNVYLYEYPSIKSSNYYIYQFPTFALYYNSQSGVITPSNSNTGFTVSVGTFVVPSANSYRYHKPDNDLYQPFYYGYELAFPSVIKGVTNGAFKDSTGLTSIHMVGIEEVGDYAFYGCSNLTGMTAPDITVIGSYAFAYSGLITFDIPAGTTSIGAYAFKGSNISDMYYGGTVSQWGAVHKSSLWDDGCLFDRVHCADGDVYL